MLTGDCEIDCQDTCAYPGEFSECEIGDLLPKVWTHADEQSHLDECPRTIDVTEFGQSEPNRVCGCGEASRHTPMAVARAEVDALTTRL